MGLYIHEDKTKYMHMKRTDLRNVPLRINNISFEKVCSLRHWGFSMILRNLIQSEMSERICKEIEHAVKIQSFFKIKIVKIKYSNENLFNLYKTCNYICL